MGLANRLDAPFARDTGDDVFVEHLQEALAKVRSFTDTFSGIAPAHAPAFILAQLIGAASATLVLAWLIRPSRLGERAAPETGV